MREIGPENVKAIALEKLDTDDAAYADQREDHYRKQHTSAQPKVPLLTRKGQQPKGRLSHRYGMTLTAEQKAAMSAGRAAARAARTEQETEALTERRRQSAKEHWKQLPDAVKKAQKERASQGQKLWFATAPKEEVHRRQSKGPHVRYHANGGKFNPECYWCQQSEIELEKVSA
ncbi:hypothetical protein [Arthrobacter sp. QXT-31]|uniref:hypothetical protein n=1 Tax=Arthrobacter sp. QXT-31 TaxID=1357915 RepID=UPI0009717400|nr:hypothetical protein [Arthrobacter sp. QXT-31]APX03382.1 hypothetical protein BWQ92_18125 [Arthrobacter sp. QXT-31]